MWDERCMRTSLDQHDTKSGGRLVILIYCALKFLIMTHEVMAMYYLYFIFWKTRYSLSENETKPTKNVNQYFQQTLGIPCFITAWHSEVNPGFRGRLGSFCRALSFLRFLIYCTDAILTQSPSSQSCMGSTSEFSAQSWVMSSVSKERWAQQRSP